MTYPTSRFLPPTSDVPHAVAASAFAVAVVVCSAGCAGQKGAEESEESAASQKTGSSTSEEVGDRVDLPLEEGSTETDGEPGRTVETLGSEVQRTMSELADEAIPPYYVSYQVTEVKSRSVTASFGAVESAESSDRRILDLDVRVGSYQLDNTHKLRGQFWRSYRQTQPTAYPFDDRAAAEKTLWKATDAEYRGAVERYKKVRANQAIKAPESDRSADFLKGEAVEHVEPKRSLQADLTAWKKRARQLSDVFSEFEALENGTVRFREVVRTRYQATAEGARVRKVRHTAHVSWFGKTTADDGMHLRLYDAADAFSVEALPGDDQLESRIRGMGEKLEKLRKAPKAEPFVGPAILEGEAAGVFFHEALGHRVEGHRQVDESEGQTFREKVGEQVLPRFLDVYDDPRLSRAGGVALMGHYRIDDQAMPAGRADIVERGTFEGFLMSRTPFGDFQSSNGHGRREAGKRVVARQGNLVIHPRRTVPESDLKEKLIEEIKRQDKPYGLRFVRVQGGFTLTGRYFPQSFRVLPLLVYRVYPDGSEELIRGVTLEGTPLTVLSNIAAAGDDVDVFNGMCGAESGRVPVSSVSPSLLVERVETARGRKATDRPPILSPPPNEPEGDDG